MKTRIRLKGFKFNRGSFTKTLNEQLDVLMRNAARQWLRSVIEHVPVWLGTSRGSLIPLGQFLKVAVPISPSPIAPQRPGLGPAAGAAKGFFEFKHLEKQVQFTFRTDVLHYMLNEVYEHDPVVFHLIHLTPWKSFEAGRQAFEQYINTNLKNKIPKLKDFILREDIYRSV